MKRVIALSLLVAMAAVPTVVLASGVNSPIAGATRELSVRQKDAVRVAEDSSVEDIPVTEITQNTEENSLIEIPITVKIEPEDDSSVIENSDPEITQEPEQQYVIDFTEDEFYLMCVVVEVEAGNCSEDCRQLIADTIINRVSEYGSLTETLYAPKQFTCVWDGGIERCSVPSESTIRICRQELKQVGYPSVWFFRTKHYFKSLGTPFCEIDGVYFSTR